jgi:hypothetical protein
MKEMDKNLGITKTSSFGKAHKINLTLPFLFHGIGRKSSPLLEDRGSQSSSRETVRTFQW